MATFYSCEDSEKGQATAIHDIRLNDLLQPTDRFVVSSIPVTTIKKIN